MQEKERSQQRKCESWEEGEVRSDHVVGNILEEKRAGVLREESKGTARGQVGHCPGL